MCVEIIGKLQQCDDERTAVTGVVLEFCGYDFEYSEWTVRSMAAEILALRKVASNV